MSNRNRSLPRRPPAAWPLALLAALGTLAWTAAPAAARSALQSKAEGADARGTLSGVLDHVSSILLSDQMEKQEKREQVRQLIDDNVDFEVVSRLVLASNWRNFSEDQRKQFVDLFRRHLLNTYWRNADLGSFKGIEITGDRKELRRDWTVMTRVHVTGDDILIDYRLRQLGDDAAPGPWRIIDILVEGVSLVSNFRSQFQSIVSNDGPDGLIRLLRDKVEEAEKAQAAEDSKDQASGG